MIGRMIYSNISLTYSSAGESHRDESGWSGSVHYMDEGFLSDNVLLKQVGTEGELHTRYLVKDEGDTSAVVVVLETLVTDMARLKIAPMKGNLTIFVTNREDQELGQDGTSPDLISDADVAAIRRFADEYGYKVFGA